jgi:DnaJ family protein A protein 2
LILEALERLLPSKKPDMDPMPEIVDEVPYEEGDIVDVRARSFPAGSDFFDQGFASQFGEGDDDDWEDDDGDDYDNDNMGGEPECRPQ